jgi:hypothetical protein
MLVSIQEFLKNKNSDPNFPTIWWMSLGEFCFLQWIVIDVMPSANCSKGIILPSEFFTFDWIHHLTQTIELVHIILEKSEATTPHLTQTFPSVCQVIVQMFWLITVTLAWMLWTEIIDWAKSFENLNKSICWILSTDTHIVQDQKPANNSSIHSSEAEEECGPASKVSDVVLRTGGVKGSTGCWGEPTNGSSELCTTVNQWRWLHVG